VRPPIDAADGALARGCWQPVEDVFSDVALLVRRTSIGSLVVSALAGATIGGAIAASLVNDWLHIPPIGIGGPLGSAALVAIYFFDRILNARHARYMVQEKRIIIETYQRHLQQTIHHALEHGGKRSIEIGISDGTYVRIDSPPRP
jgi:hypothetical protein